MSRFKLPETVTVWTPSGNDGFGGVTWIRTETKARTARRTDRVRDDNGDMIDVKLAVYTRVLIGVKSFVAKGSIADLTPPSTAYEVRVSADNESMTDMNVCYG